MEQTLSRGTALLNHDVLIHIFSFLPAECILKACIFVCKAWHLAGIETPLRMVSVSTARVDDVASILQERPQIRGLTFTQSEDLRTLDFLTCYPKRARTMESLRLSHTRLRFLRPLRLCANLRSIDLSHSLRITNVDDMAECAQLRHIDLSYTNVRHLDALASLTKIRHINLAHTHVKDLTPLYGSTTSLRHLNIANTQIKTLEEVSEFKSLEVLIVRETSISTLKPLEECLWLHSLDASKTRLTEIKPLAKCRALSVLVLAGTPITDLSPLKRMRHLRALDIRETRVTSLAPLVTCPSLETLDVRRSYVPESEIRSLAPSAIRNVLASRARRLVVARLENDLIGLEAAMAPVSQN
eukprot:Colp12_sorted_trinity150504_noHs@29998